MLKFGSLRLIVLIIALQFIIAEQLQKYTFAQNTNTEENFSEVYYDDWCMDLSDPQAINEFVSKVFEFGNDLEEAINYLKNLLAEREIQIKRLSKNPATADKSLERYIKNERKLPLLYNYLYQLLKQSNRMKEAEESKEKTIKLINECVNNNPEDISYFKKFAAILNNYGERKQANRLQNLIGKSENKGKTNFHSPYIKKSTAMWKQKKYKESLEAAEKALEFKPGLIEAEWRVARAYALLPNEEFHNPKKAIQIAENICNKTSFKIPYYVYILAESYVADGQVDKGLKLAHDALDSASKQNNEWVLQQITAGLNTMEEKKKKDNL